MDMQSGVGVRSELITRLLFNISHLIMDQYE